MPPILFCKMTSGDCNVHVQCLMLCYPDKPLAGEEEAVVEAEIDAYGISPVILQDRFEHIGAILAYYQHVSIKKIRIWY